MAEGLPNVLKFEAELYSVTYPKVTRNSFISGISIGVGVLSFVLQEYEIISIDILSLVILGCLLPFIVMSIVAMVRVEEHTKKPLGMVAISVEGIIWSREQIDWTDILGLNIWTRCYEGEWITSRLHHENKLSAGVGSKIAIQTEGGRVFESNFLLDSAYHKERLNQVLKEVVKAKKVPYDIAKKLVVPENYKAHQELKEYLHK